MRSLTCVNTGDAVDHDKHGTSTNGFGQFVAASDALCPPIESPVTPNGPRPIRSQKWSRTKFSSTKQPPITNMSETLFKFDRLLCKETSIKF